MGYFIDKTTEEALLTVAGDKIKKGIYLDDYKNVAIRIYTEEVFKTILDEFKFKDIGNSFDFPYTMPQDDNIEGADLIMDYEIYKRIAISRKYNMIAFYTSKGYYIECTFLVETDKLKKFSKRVKKIIKNDSTNSLFKKNDLLCKDGEYIEICDTNDDKKYVDVVKKDIPKEHLVFDEGSTINEVMEDIKTFFEDETKKLYKKLEIPYKRGIILYGDPGNGKSAMIRELIRNVEGVSKVIINPNVRSVTKTLSALIKAMDGSPVIIVIEDIDSVIDDRNRSELLNIFDGVDIKSGVFFIGTTNYYEKIDPAFMNRSGRFDRTYKIDNPNEATRRLFFESRQVDRLLSGRDVYRESDTDKSKSIIDLFVEYSEDLPMANLKELITSVSYLIASNKDITTSEAIVQTANRIKDTRKEHIDTHNQYVNSRNRHNDRRPSLLNSF